MKVYFVQLTLTKSCNQKCYYCDVFDEQRIVTVDLDFLKYVLNCHPNNTFVELSGGEPGLIENIDEVFKICYNHKNVKGIQLMSNGLMRKNNFDWMDKVSYYEHLIYDIEEKEIKKFYDLDFIERPNIKYVIVTTEKTTKSLVNNWKHFNFNKNMFWFKLMNPKTHNFFQYSEELIKLFQLVGDNNSIKMINFSKNKISLNFNRNLCSKFPPQPSIDFETKEIVHCATILMKGERRPFTRENIELNLKGKLFLNDSSCNNCFTFDMSPTKMEDCMKCIKGFPINRRYSDTAFSRNA